MCRVKRPVCMSGQDAPWAAVPGVGGCDMDRGDKAGGVRGGTGALPNSLVAALVSCLSAGSRRRYGY